MKRCSACSLEKSKEAFRYKRGGFSSRCRKCLSKQSAECRARRAGREYVSHEDRAYQRTHHRKQLRLRWGVAESFCNVWASAWIGGWMMLFQDWVNRTGRVGDCRSNPDPWKLRFQNCVTNLRTRTTSRGLRPGRIDRSWDEWCTKNARRHPGRTTNKWRSFFGSVVRNWNRRVSSQ